MTARRSPKHLAFIRRLPCVACSATPCEAAHVRIGTDGGMGLKPSDKFTVPLCATHHRLQHDQGERTFWRDLWIEPTDLAAQLFAVTGDDAMGRTIVMMMRRKAILARDGMILQ
jgi:hypothetical protein